MSLPDKIRHPKKRAFLAAYVRTASIVRAAQTARIDRQDHYNWMKKDPAYAEAFDKSKDIAAQTLEDEAVRRAHQGCAKAVYHQGKRVGIVTEYSDTLLIFLLKGLRPEKYRERYEHSGKVDGGQINVDIRAAVMQVINQLPEDSRAIVARGLLEIEKAG